MASHTRPSQLSNASSKRSAECSGHRGAVDNAAGRSPPGAPAAKRQRKLLVPVDDLQESTSAAIASKAASKTERIERLEHESSIWRAKYRKAFPSFVFYFDQLEPSVQADLRMAIQSLGGRVNNFFSREVSHVVSSRALALPVGQNKENDPSPIKTASKSGKIPPIRTKPSDPYGTQPFQMYGPGNEKPEGQDVLSKALEFGLKVWRLEKIQNILGRLSTRSPSKSAFPARRKPSLPTLLRDEQVYGTRERDPFVLRPDTHYFSAHNSYILVEDSTAQHRPIVIKEYERPTKGADPAWPILWGGIEGRTGFYHYTGPPVNHESRRAPTPPTNPGFAMAAARAVAGGVCTNTAPNLRRTASLNRITKRSATVGSVLQPLDNNNHRALGNSYIAASGNSQIITSNVASATSTRSGAAQQMAHNRQPMAKRIELLNRNQISFSTKSSQQILAQGKLKRSASVDAGLNCKAPPQREEPKKPGYCENCRLKYDDFHEHVFSRKHRKFARNPANWLDLDQLLSKITRPVRCYSPREILDSLDLEEGDSGFHEESFPPQNSSEKCPC